MIDVNGKKNCVRLGYFTETKIVVTVGIIHQIKSPRKGLLYYIFIVRRK